MNFEDDGDENDISMMSVTQIYHNCQFKILSFLALGGGLQASTNITILSTTVRNHQKHNLKMAQIQVISLKFTMWKKKIKMR